MRKPRQLCCRSLVGSAGLSFRAELSCAGGATDVHQDRFSRSGLIGAIVFSDDQAKTNEDQRLETLEDRRLPTPHACPLRTSSDFSRQYAWGFLINPRAVIVLAMTSCDIPLCTSMSGVCLLTSCDILVCPTMSCICPQMSTDVLLCLAMSCVSLAIS